MNLVKYLVVVSWLVFVPGLRAGAIYIGPTYAGLSLFTPTPGVTFEAEGGNFTYTSKCAGCDEGLGVSGGPVGDEIDPSESVMIRFATPHIVNSIVIGYLYPSHQFNGVDDANEGIVLEINGGTIVTFIATGSTTGSSSGPGSWQNLQPAQYGSGGSWVLINPFADLQVTSLRVKAFVNMASCEPSSPSAQITTGCSDFTINGLDISEIPEPGTIALLGTAVTVLAAWTRTRGSKLV